MCERNMGYICKEIFLIFWILFWNRKFFVLLSRTVNIVILINFAAIITLFLHMQLFYPYVLRIRIEIQCSRTMKKNMWEKKSGVHLIMLLPQIHL